MGLTMKIKYTGESDMSYTTGKTYTAKALKVSEWGEDNFAVYDNDGDWFLNSGDYIRSNFEILEEKEI
jgi:hypothetical protein